MEIRCSICNTVLLIADQTDQDDLPLLMYEENRSVDDAMDKIQEHPITPTYMKWLEEGDPRWWSPWFCECDGCEPIAK